MKSINQLRDLIWPIFIPSTLSGEQIEELRDAGLVTYDDEQRSLVVTAEGYAANKYRTI